MNLRGVARGKRNSEKESSRMRSRSCLWLWLPITGYSADGDSSLVWPIMVSFIIKRVVWCLFSIETWLGSDHTATYSAVVREVKSRREVWRGHSRDWNNKSTINVLLRLQFRWCIFLRYQCDLSGMWPSQANLWFINAFSENHVWRSLEPVLIYAYADFA